MSISAVQHTLKALEIKSERPDYDGCDMPRGETWLPADYQERVAIFRTYCSDKITAPSHITNMDEIPLTFNIPLTHKVEKKGPALWRYAQRGTRSRRSLWFSAATITDRALDDGRQTLLHKDYEAAAGKL
ncbi:hypothetical protein D4764_06G0008330 [Takifugu flavidus]|uniref:Uncharacterized protein n=1 Tax=Takifugu flavidus TaxID=433684 RepID=A0A5C6MWC1_9TELE|nr:hypothetical protein D4764_06G0008330 [Takifugu flavidus]